jgi:hypothetical protein
MTRGRILHIAWRYPPCYCSPTGSARNYALSEGLQSLGWDVTVLAGQPMDSPCACWSGRRVPEPVDSLARVVYVGSRTRRTLVKYAQQQGTTPWGRMRRRRYAFEALPFDATTNFLDEASRSAVALADRMPPNIVLYSGRPIAGILPTVQLARRLGAASVIHLHDSIMRMARDRGHRILRSASLLRAIWGLHNADVVTSISPEEAARDARVARRKIAVVEGGFDRSHWAEVALRSQHLDAEQVFGSEAASVFRIVYTGRIYDFQDPTVLLGALRKASEYCKSLATAPTIMFCIFGPGAAQWQASVEKAGVSEFVRFFGEVDRDRASIVLTKTHLATLLGRRDGATGNFGQKLFDYLASGAPILYTPGHAADSGATKIAQVDAGITTLSVDSAAAYLIDLIRQWEHDGRAEPAADRIAVNDRRQFSFDARVHELDELLYELVQVRTSL